MNDYRMIIGKSRQVGKSWMNASLMAWRSKYERSRLRKETIKRLFNI